MIKQLARSHSIWIWNSKLFGSTVNTFYTLARFPWGKLNLLVMCVHFNIKILWSPFPLKRVGTISWIRGVREAQHSLFPLASPQNFASSGISPLGWILFRVRGKGLEEGLWAVRVKSKAVWLFNSTRLTSIWYIPLWVLNVHCQRFLSVTLALTYARFLERA